ncbi:hypothetical protein RFI_12469, partial [Reticulomyxa filosa]
DFDENVANYSGGTVFMSGNVQECNTLTVNFDVLSMQGCHVYNGLATLHGGGVSGYCCTVKVDASTFASNVVWYTQAGEGHVDMSVPDDNLEISHGSTMESPNMLATTIADKSGGGGGAVYGYRCSMIVRNSEFYNNMVSPGNGGAIMRDWGVTMHQDSYNTILMGQGEVLYALFEITNNTFAYNRVNTSMQVTATVGVSECSLVVMDGLAGALWADVNGEWDGKSDDTSSSSSSSSSSFLICGNSFKNNSGVWVAQVYFSLFGKGSARLINASYCASNIEEPISTMGGIVLSKTTSMVGMNTPQLQGKVDDCSADNCLGTTLPGDLLLMEIVTLDAFGHSTNGIISCSQLYWTTWSSSASTSSELQSDDFAFHPLQTHLELKVLDAPINVEEHIAFNDTHQLFHIDYYMLTTLCKDGTTTNIATDVAATICNVTQMASVTFQCSSDCTASQYLFTRWEPACYTCPKEGVTCNGGSNVTIDYGYYGSVNYSWMWTTPIHTVNVCTITFETYLCPINLCCNQYSGCVFDGIHTSSLCAKNRDPSVPFCGKCLDGLPNMRGKSLVSVFNPSVWRHGAAGLLLIKRPHAHHPLFTYVFKSFLYFYQVLPMLSNQSYSTIIGHLTNVMNLELFGGNQNSGTCLLKDMTNFQKLSMGLIFPMILFSELLLLYFVPKFLLCWCQGRVDGQTPSFHQSSEKSNRNPYNMSSQPYTEQNKATEHDLDTLKKTHGNMVFLQTIPSENDNTSVFHDDMNTSLQVHSYHLTPYLGSANSVSRIRTESFLPVTRALTCSQKVQQRFHEAFWNSVLITYIVIATS